MKPGLTSLFFLICAFSAHAQNCTGGLGDPIVNITFGSGVGFGPPLATGITNMDYQTFPCVLDNAYEIVHNTNNCYPGDWVQVNADHTGDPNGYFMLIGASNQPSDFYVQTVSQLCPSTTYQFAAWVLNLASQTGEIHPNIRFSIEKPDGTVLQSFSTGDIPISGTATWNQYAFFFTTPPGISSVILRMTNNAPGGYGNDLLLDDITFRAAGAAVTVAIDGHTGDTVTMCPDLSNNLQFIGTVENCYTVPSYQWQQSTDNGEVWNDLPGGISVNYTANTTVAGKYLYRLAVAETGNIGISTCRVASVPDTIVILEQPAPAVTIAADVGAVCAGSPVNFTASPTDGGPGPSYQWLINSAPVGTNDPFYSSNTLNDGDQISCVLVSDATCAKSPTAVSNILPVSVLPNVLPTLDIISSAGPICNDSLVTFTAEPVSGGAHPSYQWLVNGLPAGRDTSVYSSRSLQNGDVISAVMTSSLACSSPVSATNTVTMTVYQKPAIILTPDTVIAGGRSIRLNPLITGDYLSWQWTPIDGLDLPGSLTPLATPVSSITYELRVTNQAGCNAYAKEAVKVFYDFSMPNAFTPNGDGKNDLFRIPPALSLTITRFEVFNRWGQRVFSTSNSSEGWNGRLGDQSLPTGTYVWVIAYFNPLTRQSVPLKGTVELIR